MTRVNWFLFTHDLLEYTDCALSTLSMTLLHIVWYAILNSVIYKCP